MTGLANENLSSGIRPYGHLISLRNDFRSRGGFDERDGLNAVVAVSTFMPRRSRTLPQREMFAGVSPPQCRSCDEILIGTIEAFDAVACSRSAIL